MLQVFKEEKKTKLELMIMCNTSKELRPAVIFVHGGSWHRSSKEEILEENIYPIAQKLVEKNVVVISIDYRLAPDSIFPLAVEDCKDAIRWVHKESVKYNIDTEKIHIWGISAGGHLALLAGLSDHTIFLGEPSLSSFSSKIQSIIAWFAPTDLIESPENVNSELQNQVLRSFMGNDYKSIPEKYIQASPTTYLQHNSPDILFMHGDQDTTVPIQQAYRFNQVAKSVNKKITLKIVKGAEHGFWGKDQEYAQQEILHFLKLQ